MNSELFALLLRDAAHLIRPLPVTTISTEDTENPEIKLTSHPHLNAILVLSDLRKLFEASARPHAVAHKLQFYAAHIVSIPSQILRSLAEEILARASGYQVEE